MSRGTSAAVRPTVGAVSPPRHRFRPTAAAGLVLAAVLLLMAGCGAVGGVVRGTVSTIRLLDDKGFDNPQIQPRGGDVVLVNVTTKDSEDLDAAAIEAAGVVWGNLPLRIERLEVTCRNGFGGRGAYRADRAELEQRFGARDPTLDEGFDTVEPRTIAIVAGAVVLGGLLVLAGLIVLVVVLVRRNRKRRTPPGPQGPPPGWETQPPPPGYRP